MDATKPEVTPCPASHDEVGHFCTPPLVGCLRFANGDVLEFTDPDKYIAAFKEELDYKATTGMTHETLTDAPEVRKAIDDAIYNLYGEDNPRPLADYEKKSEMTMGGMQP